VRSGLLTSDIHLEPGPPIYLMLLNLGSLLLLMQNFANSFASGTSI
jgi:hypothetical protein